MADCFEMRQWTNSTLQVSLHTDGFGFITPSFQVFVSEICASTSTQWRLFCGAHSIKEKKNQHVFWKKIPISVDNQSSS